MTLVILLIFVLILFASISFYMSYQLDKKIEELHQNGWEIFYKVYIVNFSEVFLPYARKNGKEYNIYEAWEIYQNDKGV